jgi:hypothetical protein
MKTPNVRTRKIAAAAATPLAVLIAGGLVWQASYAAFSGQTRNSGNEWSTGSVAITDDDNGSARFQVTNMVPGQTDSRCIAVTANATAASEVRAYTVNPVGMNQDLARHVLIEVERGTGGGFGSCGGFTPIAAPLPKTPLREVSAKSSWDNAISGWAAPEGKTTHVYKFSWTFDTTGMTQTEIDGLQNKSVGVDLQWELQTK